MEQYLKENSVRLDFLIRGVGYLMIQTELRTGK